MRLFSILAALSLCPSATGQVQLQFSPTQANYIRVLGGKIFIGSQQTSNSQGFNPTSNLSSQMVISPRTSLVLGGSGNDIPVDAKLDPSGNIWIVGSTDSDDFPLVNPIVSQKLLYQTAGFVMELNPTATAVLFATYLGGHRFTSSSSIASALTIDAAGYVYVGGLTNEPDFPITAGVLLPTGPGPYALKISPSGKLIYSTFLKNRRRWFRIRPATCNY